MIAKGALDIENMMDIKLGNMKLYTKECLLDYLLLKTEVILTIEKLYLLHRLQFI